MEQIQKMNKEKVISYLKNLNQTKTIKIHNSDKKRTIFKSIDTFNKFGEMDKGVLTPFNDYSYSLLNGFFDNVIYLIDHNDFEDFEELKNEIINNLNEWIDSETDVYTHDLTKWLNSSNDNVYYITEAQENGCIENGFELLKMAQYKAIDEFYNNALELLINDLETEFN